MYPAAFVSLLLSLPLQRFYNVVLSTLHTIATSVGTALPVAIATCCHCHCPPAVVTILTSRLCHCHCHLSRHPFHLRRVGGPTVGCMYRRLLTAAGHAATLGDKVIWSRVSRAFLMATGDAGFPHPSFGARAPTLVCAWPARECVCVSCGPHITLLQYGLFQRQCTGCLVFLAS